MTEHSAPTPRETILALHASGGCDVFTAIRQLDQASKIGESRRKNSGVVYTPKEVALDMCRLASPSIDDTVFEPSCGRGVFVFALAEYHLQTHSPAEACAKLARNLAACDIDPTAVEDLRVLWGAYWKAKGVASPEPIRALREDSLFGLLSKESFDLALGNPPYVRFQNLPPDYRAKLQGAFDTCKSGNVDLFFAFVERSLVQCKRSCLIFPNSWLASKSGQALRSFMGPRTLKLADYGDKLVFAPVRAYVCIALASSAARPAAIPMLVQTDGLKLADAWTPIPAGDARVRDARWTLSAAQAKSSPPSPSSAPAASAPQTLGDIATLFSGIATLSDGSYAIHGARVEAGLATFHDAKLGRELSVPLACAPKKIKMTKVSCEADLAAWSERILYPYDGAGKLIAFADIQASHKDMADMLLERKARLAERDSGEQSDYPEWHAYGRKQGLKALPPGELCAMPVMAQGSIQCFAFDTQNTGPFLFTSGFVLAPKPGHTCSEIIAALQSPVSWQWALSHGKPWAGSPGKVYRSFGARLLLSMPLPPAPAPISVPVPVAPALKAKRAK